MRTYLVEVSPPFFDQNLRLGARTKPFEAQTLVAELAVEALRDAILPRLAGFDQCRADALRDDPRQQCLRHELGPVVATELEGQGVAAIWFNLFNRHEQYGGNDADAEDVNESQQAPLRLTVVCSMRRDHPARFA